MKVAAAVVMVAIATCVSAQSKPQMVLFVCEHGAAKSVVAAAHFNKIAAERGLPFRAISRGTAPDPVVPPAILTGLGVEGLAPPVGFMPTRVTANDVHASSVIVTFDVALPMSSGRAPVIQWNKLPAFSDAYLPASAAIAARVDALARELEQTIKK